MSPEGQIKRLHEYVQSRSRPDDPAPAHALFPGNEERELNSPYFTFLTASILRDAGRESGLSLNLEGTGEALRRNASRQGTYNYWQRGSAEAKQQRLPDDWDDTALAYSLLSAYPSLPIAKNYPLLRAASDPSGYFQTWILPDRQPRWHDLDLWVNLNILYWLTGEGIFLPAPWQTALTDLEQGNAISKYYPNQMIAWFFFLRCLALPNAREILRSRDPGRAEGAFELEKTIIARCEKAGRRPDLTWTEKGLLAASLSPEGPSGYRIRRWLEDFLGILPVVPAEPFIFGWQEKVRPVYDGSRSLTASFFLLAACRIRGKGPSAARTAATGTFSLPLSTEALKALAQLGESSFVQELEFLPHEVSGLLGKRPEPEYAAEQALTNRIGWLYFWIDDCLCDGHPLSPSLAKEAPAIQRLYEDRQAALLPPGHRFHADWRRWQATYRAMQSYEAGRLRFSPLAGFSGRAFSISWARLISGKFAPYVAACAAVAARCLSAEDYPGAVVRLQRLYTHYLLARQYSDDARDALADLREGRLTPWTEAVLRNVPGCVADLSDKDLERIFIQKVSHVYNRRILYHASKALALLQSDFPTHGAESPLAGRLKAISDRVGRARRQQRELMLILGQELRVSK